MDRFKCKTERRAIVVFDEWRYGDVSRPIENKLLKDEDIIQLNRIIHGKHKPNNETRIFKSVGMALFNITVSQTIYQSVIEKNIGMNISI